MQAVGALTLECIQGDISAQCGIDIVVDAANRRVKSGGGVDGAINRAAGPRLIKAYRASDLIESCEAVIMPASALSSDYVIHGVGLVHSKRQPVAVQLARC